MKKQSKKTEKVKRVDQIKRETTDIFFGEETASETIMRRHGVDCPLKDGGGESRDYFTKLKTLSRAQAVAKEKEAVSVLNTGHMKMLSQCLFRIKGRHGLWKRQQNSFCRIANSEASKDDVANGGIIELDLPVAGPAVTPETEGDSSCATAIMPGPLQDYYCAAIKCGLQSAGILRFECNGDVRGTEGVGDTSKDMFVIIDPIEYSLDDPVNVNDKQENFYIVSNPLVLKEPKVGGSMRLNLIGQEKCDLPQEYLEEACRIKNVDEEELEYQPT